MQFVNPDLSTKIIVSRLCAMIAALSLCSCYIEEDKKYWHLRYEPTTPEEHSSRSGDRNHGKDTGQPQWRKSELAGGD